MTAYTGKRVFQWEKRNEISAAVSGDAAGDKDAFLPLFNAETERQWKAQPAAKQEEHEATSLHWNQYGPPDEVKREYVLSAPSHIVRVSKHRSAGI